MRILKPGKRRIKHHRGISYHDLGLFKMTTSYPVVFEVEYGVRCSLPKIVSITTLDLS
jgi:hypothetical protein